MKLVNPGTYFWRVACRRNDSPSSEWSSARRFRVYSSASNVILEDTTPPELTIDPPQQLGRMFIIEGTTEIGATITINGERVELGVAGKFRKTVEMFKEGWNDILIVATDPSGNHSEHRERVFVEVY
jgi:hypothetical protein